MITKEGKIYISGNEITVKYQYTAPSRPPDVVLHDPPGYADEGVEEEVKIIAVAIGRHNITDLAFDYFHDAVYDSIIELENE